MRVPCGNRTRLASLEGWCLCRSAKGTKAEGERIELSRLIARPRSGRLPSPVGLTFHSEAPVAGLEPAVGQTPRRLNRPIPATNSGTPDRKVRTAGFEPALSCSRSTRNTRLSYVLFKSAQRELDPRFLHGKQVGFRYIMGALWCAGLSKIKEHRAGLEPASPHYGCGILAAGRPVHQWDQRDLNPHLTD